MKTYLFNALVAAVVFGVMDSIWFAVFMKKFANNQINHLLRLNGGQLSAHLPSALAAYLLMIIVAVIFLLPKITQADSWVTSFMYGAIMGVCIFGIFDFTNGALLKDYPLKFIIVDTLWGGFMYGCLGIAYYKLN